jgi:hypothetical protein
MNASLHDPGGKVRIPILAEMTGGASFSDCGKYRYVLQRWWGPATAPYALWIGMNPSTADADVDDPTVRKELRMTKRMGVAGYIKCNVMDYRATSPKMLLKPGVIPCSDGNVETIAALANPAAEVILCYGVLHPSLQRHADAVVEALSRTGRQIMCLGLTKDGHPIHPLYQRDDTALVPFKGIVG